MGKKNMKGKKEIVVGIVVAVMVLLTLFFYLTSTGEIDLDKILLVGICLVLVILAMYIIWDRIKNVQKGLPAKDERLININYKAGYYAFIASIWSALFAPLLFDVFSKNELTGGDVTAIVILTSGFVFVVSYLYLYQKGK
jgi:predicted transporter